MDKTVVVILHYKGEDDTLECLNSLMKESSLNNSFEPIVVCNQPTKNFVSKLKKDYPKIEVIKNQENLGFAEGNNLGIKRALEFSSQYILLLNNDTLLGSRLINKLVSFARSERKIGLVSPKIYFAPGFEYHRNRYRKQEKGRVIWYAGGTIDWSNVYASHRGVDEVDKGQFEEVSETDFATGCCLLIKREVVEKIGFLDKKYFLYFEDIDYSVRAKKAGFKVVYYPGAFLWHKNASASEKPGSPLHLYYQTRNRLYFGYKYASWKAKKALFFESLKFILRGGLRASAVWDYYLGKMGKGLL